MALKWPDFTIVLIFLGYKDLNSEITAVKNSIVRLRHFSK